MYCGNCGTKIEKGNFCPKCGTKIEVEKSILESDSIELDRSKESASQLEGEVPKKGSCLGFMVKGIGLFLAAIILIGVAMGPVDDAETSTEDPAEVVKEDIKKIEKKEETKEIEKADKQKKFLDNTYIIADSAERYYYEQELSDKYSYNDLVYAKNEIYARHGYIFKGAEFKSYFEGKAWYEGTVKAEAFDTSVFNQFELSNIQAMQNVIDYYENRPDEVVVEEEVSGASELRAMMPLPGCYTNSASPYIITIDEDVYESALSQAVFNEDIMVSILLTCQREGDDYIEEYEGMINLLSPGMITIMTGVQSATYIEYDNKAGKLSNAGGIVSDYVSMHKYYYWNTLDDDYYEDNEVTTYYLYE